MGQHETVFDKFINTEIPCRRWPLLLAVLLVAGLVFGTPLFAAMINVLGIPLPLPILIGVFLVGGIYALVSLALRRIALGLSVAVIVTAMFAANIPLTAANTYPGELGPQIWIVQPYVLV